MGRLKCESGCIKILDADTYETTSKVLARKLVASVGPELYNFAAMSKCKAPACRSMSGLFTKAEIAAIADTNRRSLRRLTSFACHEENGFPKLENSSNASNCSVASQSQTLLLYAIIVY